MRLEKLRITLEIRKKIIKKSKSLGDKAPTLLGGLDKYVEYVDRMQNLDFCKTYAEERKWMMKVKVDFSELPEEKKFIELIKKHQLKERKQVHLKAKHFVASMKKFWTDRGIIYQRVLSIIRVMYRDIPEHERRKTVMERQLEAAEVAKELKKKRWLGLNRPEQDQTIK